MKQENRILEVDSEINKLLKIFTSRLRKLIIRDFFLNDLGIKDTRI